MVPEPAMIGTSTAARTVTGVRGGNPVAETRTVSPLTVRSVQARPTPYPTEHWAPVTPPGRVIEMSARSIWLFHAGAITFQKKAEGADGSPVDDANVLPAPTLPGSRTPSMV